MLKKDLLLMSYLSKGDMTCHDQYDVVMRRNLCCNCLVACYSELCEWSSYEDDRDEGEWFLYTGSGGRDLSGNKRTNKVNMINIL